MSPGSSSWSWSLRCWLLRPSSPSTSPWRMTSCCLSTHRPWPPHPHRAPYQQPKVENLLMICTVYDFKRHVLDFYNVFCAFSSPAAYGHSQRLSDGDQWSSEQSRQWLGHHQFRGEPHYKLIGCSFIFSDFILVLFLARLWRWIMLLLYSHMLTILTSVTTDPWDNCQSVYCPLWQIKKGEIRYQFYAF